MIHHCYLHLTGIMLARMVDNSEDAQHPQHFLPHREVRTDEQGPLR